MFRKNIAFIVILVILVSCICLFSFHTKNDSISIYQAPKEIPFGKPQIQTTSAPQKKAIQWKTPAHWKEEQASGMRLGSFKIPGTPEIETDLSIISLAGSGGGLTANINRWRGQVELEALSESEISKTLETIELRGQTLTVVDLIGPDSLAQENRFNRILAGIIKHENMHYYIKMTGEKSALEKEKPVFLDFLKSLEFVSHTTSSPLGGEELGK